MIINSEKVEDVEIDNLIGEDDSEEVSVDKENMAFFYEHMSKNMYSDPPGSIVRELTSNCFDAHREIDSDAAVVIDCRYEGDNLMMCFIDKGVGISPERWKTVFKKYLSSTKRESNKFLGAFGLGSKSPFAYVDSYDIVTVYNGIEYRYIMYKKENGIPGAELMLQKESSEPNGTTIKFAIEGKTRYSKDWYEFHSAIKNQLAYFDNVYVKNFDIDNDYKIFEADTFKYRVDTEEESMHIVLGKVKYPIKWELLGRKKILIPVGIKFEIGELMVTQNREDLRYTDEAKALLIERMDKCIEELKDYLNKGHDTIEEVFQAIAEEGLRRIKITEGISIPFKSSYYGLDKDNNGIKWPFEIPKPFLKDFKGLPIKLPDNPYFIFKVKSKISRARLLTADKEANINLWAYTHGDKKVTNLPLYRTSDFKANKYKNFKIQDAYIVEKKQINPSKIAAVIGLNTTAKSPKIPHRALDDTSPKATEKLRGVPLIGEWGNKLTLVKLYKKIITRIFIKETESYDNIVIDIDLIQRYANALEVKRPKIERKQESIYASEIGGSSEDSKEEVTEKDFNTTGFVVYSDNKQKQQLKAIYNLIEPRYSHQGNYYHIGKKRGLGKFYRFLVVNRTDVKRMESLHNSQNIEEFMLKNRVFIKQATKAIVYQILQDVVINKMVLKLVPKIANLHDTVVNNTMQNYEYNYLTKTTIGKELIKIIEEGKLYDKHIVEQAHLYVKIADDLNIFNKLNIEKDLSYDDKKDICAILVKKGYIPDSIYTTSLTEEEIKWMEEWKERGEYVSNLKIPIGFYHKEYNGLTYKTKKEEAWKSYPKSLRLNKLERTSLSLLAMTQ